MKSSSTLKSTLPAKHGLYDPAFEHDACGVGFVANIKNRKSHDIIEKGMEILLRLTHRGATGADPREGDGAGILIQIPDGFFRAVTPELHIELPKEGEYGVGMVFLPQNDDYRATCQDITEQTIAEEGQIFLGWRDVPTNTARADLPESVTCCEPVIRQVFIGKGENCADQDAFERKMYVIRRVARNRIDDLGQSGPARFYFASMSSRTIVYKGMFLSHQVGAYYEDLQDTRLTSALALVHQRFSANTFPAWELA
ncbi:MAG: glutamate synthase subunit alpha, partial [Mariprofundaceae bacterium]|nr:glutamate synthase subunit alpha [Mariprofundaceae bacterium]